MADHQEETQTELHLYLKELLKLVEAKKKGQGHIRGSIGDEKCDESIEFLNDTIAIETLLPTAWIRSKFAITDSSIIDGIKIKTKTRADESDKYIRVDEPWKYEQIKQYLKKYARQLTARMSELTEVVDAAPNEVRIPDGFMKKDVLLGFIEQYVKDVEQAVGIAELHVGFHETFGVNVDIGEKETDTPKKGGLLHTYSQAIIEYGDADQKALMSAILKYVDGTGLGVVGEGDQMELIGASLTRPKSKDRSITAHLEKKGLKDSIRLLGSTTKGQLTALSNIVKSAGVIRANKDREYVDDVIQKVCIAAQQCCVTQKWSR